MEPRQIGTYFLVTDSGQDAVVDQKREGEKFGGGGEIKEEKLRRRN